MNNCQFDPNKCSIECKKFSMCSYYNLLNKITELNTQLNFVFSILQKMTIMEEKTDLKINLLESGLVKLSNKLNDSEMIINHEEATTNETKNK